MNRSMPPRFPISLVAPLLPIGSAERSADGQARLHEEVAGAFDLFREPLLRYLGTFGLEISDSEEVLQDVFLAQFRHRARGRRIDNIRAWLFRVAHNLALRRRDRTRRNAETQLEAAGDDRTVDPAPGPEDRVVNLQNRRRVLAVVDALPEQDRRCLFLRAEGLRYREIAGIVDMSLGAVSVSIARSLARIARSEERRG